MNMPVQPNNDWLNVGQLINTYRNSLTAQSAVSPNSPSGGSPLGLLLNTKVNWGTNPQGLQGQANTGGPSVLSRFFDLLSRGQYASAEAARQIVTNDNQDENPLQQIGDVVHGAISGLAGTRKTSYSDVIQEMDYNQAVANANQHKNGPADIQPTDFYNPSTTDNYKRFLSANSLSNGSNSPTGTPDYGQQSRIQNHDIIAGLGGIAGDIALDPTAYLNPFKPIAALAKIGSASKDAITAAEDAAKLSNDAGKIENVPTLPTQAPLPAPLAAKVADAPFTPPTFPTGASGLANDATLIRPGEINTPFPNTPIPQNMLDAATAAKKNADLKDLITKITGQTTSETLPKGFGKMNKASLIDVLNNLRSNNGIDALTNHVQNTVNEVPGHWGFKPVEEAAQTTAKTAAATPPNTDDLIKLITSQANATTREAQKATDAVKAKQLADQYSQQVLNQPNAFQKGAEAPAVNGPAQQANFFNNHLLPAAKEAYPNATPIEQFAKAHSMLKVAEQHLTDQGINPRFWDNSPMNLSDVMTQVGKAAGGMSKIKQDHLTQIMTAIGNGTSKTFQNPAIQKAVDSIITANKMKETPYVQQAISAASRKADVAKEVLSEPGYQAFKRTIAAQANDEAKAASGVHQFYDQTAKDYVSPVNTKFGQAAIKGILGQETKAEKLARVQSTPVLKYISSNGKTSYSPVARAATNYIHNAIGGPSLKALGETIGPDNAAEHWLLSRIATWYGNKELRPDVLIAKSNAMANASRRASVLNHIAKSFTPEEIQTAFKVAQNGIPAGAPTPRIASLAADFKKMVQNLYAGTGLTDYAAKSSTAGRMGSLIDDANHHMQIVGGGNPFTNAAKVESIHIPGQMIDYSKGLNWMKSWENAKVSDPLEFISRLQTATEQMAHKYALLDELGGRFGSQFKDAKNGFTTQIDNPRLRGLFFQPEIAHQMTTVLKNWDGTLGKTSPFVRFFDKLMSRWKTGMTIYAPRHWITNYMGDAYNSWMDGVNNPDIYRKAAQVVMSERGRYQGLDNVENLIGKDAVTAAMRSPDKPIIRTKGGIDLTPRQVYALAHQKGILQTAHITEDISKFTPKFQPFGGRVSAFIHSKAEAGEHTMKLAHFMDILKKSKGTDINAIADEASKRVRKWRPDGLDLTVFERKYLRRIIPFYSWTRKAIPLAIESLLVHPAKVNAYPKIMHNLQVATGTAGPSQSDPFPHDQLFPNWLQDRAIGPLGLAGGNGLAGLIGSIGRSVPDSHGNPSGYTVINPRLPFNDVVSQFGGSGGPTDPIKGILGMVSPGMRIPFELGMDKTATGPPPSNDYAKYFASEVPGLQWLSQLTNATPFGPTNRGVKEGYASSLEPFINFLSGLELHGTGPDIKSAQFEQRQRAKAAKAQMVANPGPMFPSMPNANQP